MNFREQIRCVVSEEMSFETFTPYGPMLTQTKIKIAKKKIQNWKFHNSLNKFVETLPRSMHDFIGGGVGVDLVCTVRDF